MKFLNLLLVGTAVVSALPFKPDTPLNPNGLSGLKAREPEKLKVDKREPEKLKVDKREPEKLKVDKREKLKVDKREKLKVDKREKLKVDKREKLKVDKRDEPTQYLLSSRSFERAGFDLFLLPLSSLFADGSKALPG
ncbi:hypothetical protein CSHISOI_07955 [Colletotrichum shisoi]|uniref:Uncharacterized protein n=1 Tax=Colletotrichum shisoi TaxID=2078593 RepID=A0A5Q4BL52_9PEZI|nr:hypothetical protein CSHISOI_07955 [Colletotrichum shisoi]